MLPPKLQYSLIVLCVIGISLFLLDYTSWPEKEPKKKINQTIINTQDTSIGSAKTDLISIQLEPAQRARFSEQLRIAFSTQDSAQVLKLLEYLNPDNLEETLEVFSQLPTDSMYQKEFEMLFFRWGVFDPQSAIEYGMAHINAPRRQWWAAYPEAMRAWSQQDRPTAVNYLQNLQSRKANIQRLAATLAHEYTYSDPIGAMNWAISTQGDDLKTAAMITVADIVGEEQSNDLANQVFHWLSTDSDDPILAETAATWAMGHIFHGQDQTLQIIMSLPDGNVKEAALQRAFQLWAPYAPDKAAAWINAQSNQSNLDSAIVGLVNGTYQGYPEESLEWAESILSPELRGQMVKRVVTQWYQNNPEAAKSWLAGSELEPSFLENLLNQPNIQGIQ